MQTAGSLNWSSMERFGDRMYHLALPLIVMTFSSLGGMTRYVRAAMIEVLSMDNIILFRYFNQKLYLEVNTHKTGVSLSKNNQM